MKVQHLKPVEKISAYVDRILVIECHRIIGDFNLPLYANGVPTLLFISQKGLINKQRTSHLTLFGQTVLPEMLTLNQSFTLIAYFFRPHLLLSLFDVTAHELTDKPTDLSLILHKSSLELQERLLNADSTESMVVLLDNFILNLVANAKPHCPIITYAIEKITTNPSTESFVSIQKQLGITERTFQRNFEQKVGVPPRQYKRISQFNAAFQQLARREYSKLSDIAFQNGYADQSHYIRSFKEFTNITPKEYLNYKG
jgi:AraC-like DNA-binding protein